MNENSQNTCGKEGFYMSVRSEAPKAGMKATNSTIAKSQTENPTGTEELMEKIFEKENLVKALKKVKANGGSAGVDGMRVEELSEYLRVNWAGIKEQILNMKYKPKPVRRVEIKKPDGRVRKLGIPAVSDRFIQQAILQILQPIYDNTFSEQSYGFRPNRSAHQAVKKAQGYIREGYTTVVDIDLEKFFDKVNHDRLMGAIAKRIRDKRLLKLLRAYLNSGVMEQGLVKPTEEGTPQGGNLSPILSNIVLDELDKELEKRGHKFVRYADDCNIYVKTPRAGERVMRSISSFITRRLKLKVNQEKSAVDRPSRRKFLGYSFMNSKEPRLRISPRSISRFKDRIRGITKRKRGISLSRMIKELTEYIRGWMGYYRYCQTPSVLKELDSWIRRKIRCYIWKMWRTYRTRAKELIKRGIVSGMAYGTARMSGLWRPSLSKAMQLAFPNTYFEACGLFSLTDFVKV
jgi:RNA-directed DNA polymerase